MDPTWLQKLTKIVHKSMPRYSSMLTSLFNRFWIDFCSHLGSPEPNLAVAGYLQMRFFTFSKNSIFDAILVSTCFHFPSKNPSKSHHNPILRGIVFLINFCIDFGSIWESNLQPKGGRWKGGLVAKFAPGSPDASEDALDVQNPPRTPKWTQNGSPRPLKCFQNETSNPPKVHPNLTPHPHPGVGVGLVKLCVLVWVLVLLVLVLHAFVDVSGVGGVGGVAGVGIVTTSEAIIAKRDSLFKGPAECAKRLNN